MVSIGKRRQMKKVGGKNHYTYIHTLGNSGWQEEPICMKPQPHADEIAGSRNPTILWQLHYTALH